MEICISESIKRLRKDNGLTQEMLAEVLHISPQSISKWEIYRLNQNRACHKKQALFYIKI